LGTRLGWVRKYVQGGAKRQDLDTDMQKEYNRLKAMATVGS
jgi:hypothetical protein